MVTFTCVTCKIVLYQGKKFPPYCAMKCPKCGVTSKIERPKPPPKPEPIRITVPGLPLETTQIKTPELQFLSGYKFKA